MIPKNFYLHSCPRLTKALVSVPNLEKKRGASGLANAIVRRELEVGQVRFE